jgi:predicted metal-dependent HD superfamily phosphohydrolase
MEKNIKCYNLKPWLDLWHRLGVKSDYPIIDAYQDILQRYGEPHRKYHNIGHINHCLAEFETVRHLALDANALELAIWYHDAVYEIQANDNEERSASLASEVMNNFSLPLELIEKVENIIIATKHSAVPEDYDAKLMLDIDISNIGDGEKFKEANKLIREEYSSVPDNLFKNGRSGILQSFLDRPGIYLTEFFYNKYEDKAKENILSSIYELNSLN